MNSSVKEISVLMTTYNGGPYLKYSVGSVLNQTYKNFELVIVDDGSSDNTEEFISSLHDERIRYIKLTHVGRSKALNYGLKKCLNDWVALMDADDIWDTDKLSKQINEFSFEYNSISCTWSAYFTREKIKFTVNTPLNKIELKEKLLLHSYICNPSVIYNRQFILGNGGYDETLSLFEDYDLWLRLINSSKFEVISEYLVFVRYKKDSESYQGLQHSKELVLSLQNKYFQIGNHIFGINKSIENQLKGWREYFYGEGKKARQYWNRRITNILNYRIFAAYLITYFPEKFINIIKRLQIRYKIKLLISSEINDVRKRFEYVIKNLIEIL